ncbi:hypothetical protein, partial [Coxiella burnetii]
TGFALFPRIPLHMGYLLNKNARHSGPAARSFKLPPSKESIFPKIDAQE